MSRHFTPRPGLRWSPIWTSAGMGYVVLIVWLSLVPKPPSVLPFDLWDKAAHFLAYAGLAGWFGALGARPMHLRVWVGAALLGAGLELTQGLLGWRAFEWADMLANTLGALAGVWLARGRMGEAMLWIERRF